MFRIWKRRNCSGLESRQFGGVLTASHVFEGKWQNKWILKKPTTGTNWTRNCSIQAITSGEPNSKIVLDWLMVIAAGVASSTCSSLLYRTWKKSKLFISTICLFLLGRPKFVLGSAHVKFDVWTGPKSEKPNLLELLTVAARYCRPEFEDSNWQNRANGFVEKYEVKVLYSPANDPGQQMILFPKWSPIVPQMIPGPVMIPRLYHEWSRTGIWGLRNLNSWFKIYAIAFFYYCETQKTVNIWIWFQKG